MSRRQGTSRRVPRARVAETAPRRTPYGTPEDL